MKTRHSRHVSLAIALALTLGVGCSSKPEVKPDNDAPITEQETQVETEQAPSAESLAGAEEEPVGAPPALAAPDTSPVASTDAAPSPSAGPSTLDPGLSQDIGRALTDARGGDVAGATRALEALVERPNGGYLASYNLGVLYERQGRYEQAAKAYFKALQSNADFSPALLNLVRLYVRQGQLSDAQTLASRFMNQRPDNLGHRAAELEVLLAQGRHEDVEIKAREILRRDEQHVDAMLALSVAYYQLKRYELASSVLSRAQELQPERAELYYRFGLVRLRMSDKPGALASLRKAVALRPGYAEAHLNLGQLYHEARDYQGAVEQFNAAITSFPSFKEAHLSLGNAHKGLRQFRDAEVAFRKAISVDPNYASAYFNLGIMYLDSPIPGVETIPRLEKAVELLTKYKDTQRQLGRDDPADKYIAEARKGIEDEKARQEMMRQSQMSEDGT